MKKDFVKINPKKEIEKYLKKWEKLPKYSVQEYAIRELYEKYNNRFDEKALLVKCSVLNTFYSTMIMDISSVVNHYLKVKDLQERLKQGDATLVEDLKKTPNRVNYSFATKFCCHHNLDMFPIYDSFVGKILCYFRNQDSFCSFKNDELKNYPKFKEIYDTFRNYYKLNQYSYRDIDKYLWQVGKGIN